VSHACATASSLVWLAGALDVSASFFVYGRDSVTSQLSTEPGVAHTPGAGRVRNGSRF